MGEIGQVIKKEFDKVTVVLERVEACAKCKACTAGFSKEEMHIVAINTCDAKVSEFVNIELESKNFLIAVCIMYGLPLITLVTGFFAGEYFARLSKITANSELIGFLTGIIFMLLTYLYIKSIDHKFKTKDYTPVATFVVQK